MTLIKCRYCPCTFTDGESYRAHLHKYRPVGVNLPEGLPEEAVDRVVGGVHLRNVMDDWKRRR